MENQDTAPRNVTAQSKKILSTGQKEKGNIKSDGEYAFFIYCRTHNVSVCL